MSSGYVNIWIDEIVPCLKDTSSGELKDTVVFRIETKSFLEKFNTNSGWHVNWGKIPKDVEVYALTLKDNISEIQGLIGLKKDDSAKAAYIHWACTAPHNNKHDTGNQRYVGVGGHLFALACEKSIEWGYDGAVHGFAANEKLLEHYVEKLHAEPLCMLHQYQFFIDEIHAQELLEVYNYEWKST